ncbi:hypothetical protein SUDANB121_00988 [Nocardiopsis dassonvillei]|uniref:WXG100-like domain-containing protein n=1 Tax=Nocardiopsis dassonvillei TaxID=2014 RepID=UPI003F5698C6
MGMEIPDELANLFYGLTGTKWPDVDEDRLRDLSDMYATVEYILATELPELVLVLRRKVRSTFDGRTTEYFENSLAQFTAGERDYVGEAAKLAGDIRTYARDAANQVEYAKWMIIGQLVQLAIEIAWAIAMAKFTFGASLAWISMFRFIRSQAIRRILNWLVWNLLSHLFVAQLFGTTMDLLIQRIQMDQGNRDSWDKELTRMAAAGAFVEGLLGAGLSLGADMFLSKQLGKLFGDNLPGPPTPPPVRDIAEPPPVPPGRGPDPAPEPPPLRDVPDTTPAPGPRTPDPDPLGPPPVRDDVSGPPGPPNDPPGPPPGDGPGRDVPGRDGPARDVTPDPLPPGSVTPEFNRDLVTLFGRNANEFLGPAQRPDTASSGIGHGQRFVDGAGTVFARHFGGEMGEDAARRLGREYAETLLRTWNTPRMPSALDEVLSGAPLPQSTRDHLSRDVPDAFGRTVSEFGTRWSDRLTALGIGAGSGALEGYLGEGLTNLAFSPEQQWEASGMSAVAGAAGAVVQNLAVGGGLAAIDALNDLRELNNTPAPLPDPDGSGLRGPLPDDGGGADGRPLPPGRGQGDGGWPGSSSGNGEEPVLRLRGGGGDDLSFDFGSEYGDGYGDYESTYTPSEFGGEDEADAGGASDAGGAAGGRGWSGTDVTAGPSGHGGTGGERSAPPAEAGGTRETPRTESTGPGAQYAPPAGMGAGAESGRGTGAGSAGSGSGSGSGGGPGAGRGGERGGGAAEPGLSGGERGGDTTATGGDGGTGGTTANPGEGSVTRTESSAGSEENGGNSGNGGNGGNDGRDAAATENGRPATETDSGAPEGDRSTGGNDATAPHGADRGATGTGGPGISGPAGNGNADGQDTGAPGGDRSDTGTGREGDREPIPNGGTGGTGDPSPTGEGDGQDLADTETGSPGGDRGNGTDTDGTDTRTPHGGAGGLAGDTGGTGGQGTGASEGGRDDTGGGPERIPTGGGPEGTSANRGEDGAARGRGSEGAGQDDPAAAGPPGGNGGQGPDGQDTTAPGDGQNRTTTENDHHTTGTEAPAGGHTPTPADPSGQGTTAPGNGQDPAGTGGERHTADTETPAGGHTTAPDDGQNRATTANDGRTENTGTGDPASTNPPPGEDGGRGTTDPGNIRHTSEAGTGTPAGDRGDATVEAGNEAGVPGGSAGTSTPEGGRGDADNDAPAGERRHGPADSGFPDHQAAPPAGYAPPPGEAAGPRDSAGSARNNPSPPRAGGEASRNGTPPRAPSSDGPSHGESRGTGVDGTGGSPPRAPGDDASGLAAEGPAAPSTRLGDGADLDLFFRSLTPSAESTASDGTSRERRDPSREGRPEEEGVPEPKPSVETATDTGADGGRRSAPSAVESDPLAPSAEGGRPPRLESGADSGDDIAAPSSGTPETPPPPPRDEEADTHTPAPSDGKAGTPSDERGGGDARTGGTGERPQPTDTREENGEGPPSPPEEGNGDSDVLPPPTVEEDEGSAPPPPPREEDGNGDVPLPPPPVKENGGDTRPPPPVEENEGGGPPLPPPPVEEDTRPAPPEQPPPAPVGEGTDAITPVVQPSEQPPDPTGTETAPPLRLNYLIDSRWVESYGVRVDPDAVLGTRPDLPADVRDSFRSKLGTDPREFFSRDGVSETSADGTAFTLRLRSDDDWHQGGRNRGGAEKAKYKGLHDIQTQESRGESGSVGSARRPVVGFQANLLGGPGLPAPAVGFRASAFGGSAVQQQSGDSGQTRILTTEMTGSGTTYSSDLTAEWTPHTSRPPATAPRDTAPAEGTDLGPVRSEARVDGGVELVLMGGLQRRDDLPAQITFTDPFHRPPPAAPADGTGDTDGTGNTSGDTAGDGTPPPGDRNRTETAPARYGGYLANSHPISIGSITRRAGGSDTGTGTDTPTGADTGASRDGRPRRWRDTLTPRRSRADETSEPPANLNSWVAERLGFEAPGEGSNTRRLLHRPRPGSDEPKVVTRPNSGSRAMRRELDRRGVLEVFTDDIVMTQLPTMTDEPRTVRVPDAGGGTRLLTIWAPPTSMELVPETPKDFNMKFTDRFAHGASVLANRLKGFFVAVSGGMVTRVPGDMFRVDAPYFETRFQKVWAKGRGRSDNAWDARLFHSTDTAVYRTRRTIAVWLDGDTEPTLFDASGLEAVTADDARRLGGDRPDTREVEETGDPFLDRDGGPTHLGDALVRDVTHEDGSEARTGDGEGDLPRSFFRDFAHQVLLQIDRDYPGLVLPHLAVPGAPEPRRSHAGWNHRRNRRTAELNTETVLSKINSSSFRADRDAWLSGQVEIKLVETKFLPFGNELRERRFTVPDHISVWPRARVVGYSKATDPLPKSHTGTTTGSSSGIGRKSDRITSVTAEGRTGLTVRGVSGGVDSFGAPNNAGGVYFRAANEFRTRTQSEYGVSATAETNVKDKSGSRVLFADVEFSAWMGPDDSLVPRSSRWEAPSRIGLGRELFGGGEGAPAPVRAKVELHTPRNGERFALDAPPERTPEPPRYLSPSQAKRLFDRGPSAFLSENLPPRLPPLQAPPRLETITEVDEGAGTGAEVGGTEGTGRTGGPPRAQAPDVEGAPPADRTADGAPPPAEEGTGTSTRQDTGGAPPAEQNTRAPAQQNTDGTPPAEQNTDAPARRGGRRTPEPEPELRIDRTDRARRLSQLFSSTQAFNPALMRRGSEVITVTTLTYASLDRNHWSFSRTASSREGAAEVIAGRTSSQSLAASPGLQQDGGSRFRVQLDDGIAPTRTRPTTVTWYMPTHVASVLLRESAVMEPNQVKEISYGFGKSRDSVFSVTLIGRGMFSSQPTAATPDQAPRGSGGPIFQPGVELRYTPYGHGHGESSSVSFRTRREVKFTGSTFEFVTHGVVLQATEHKQDFDFLFSVPRSPGTNDHSAWAAEVRDAQKTMVPSLWVFADGLVDDSLTWGPDGRVTKGAHPPPQGPHLDLVLKPDLAGKGYDSRPVHVPSLISELEQRLRRGGWQLTTHSREDLVQTVTSHLNRGMTNLSGVEVRVVPTGTRWESSEWTPQVKDRSRVATLDLDLFPMAPRVEQIGGRMEFVDRNVKVTSTSESDTTFRGYGGGAALDILAPIGNREDPETGRQVGAVNAGGTPGYRGQTLLENSSSENRAREETQERVVFTPFAVVTTPTRVDASLRIGDRVYTASVLDQHAESVYPLPYLETLGGDNRVDPPGTRYRPAEFERTEDGSYPDDWAALHRGPEGRGYQDGTAGIDSVPLAVEKNGREILDAAVVNAARLAGWSRTGTGDLTPAEVDAAARFLDRRITDIERAAGITVRKQEMLLLSLTPEATEDAVSIAEYGGTVVRTRALLNTDGAVIEAVSGESRARDSDQEGARRSQNTSENRARNAGLGGQVTETARPGDRLRENLDADNAALSGAKDGVSSGQREGAVAEGPGTKRMFLVRIPARWLVWAQNSDGSGAPVGSESDSSVLRWVDEDQARAWGLATDAPEIGRYSDAEAAFTKADAAYLKARGELFEFVNRVDPDSADATLREEYRQREAKYAELEEARNRAMREMVDALGDLRALGPRTAPPVETPTTATDSGETHPAPIGEESPAPIRTAPPVGTPTTTTDSGGTHPAPIRTAPPVGTPTTTTDSGGTHPAPIGEESPAPIGTAPPVGTPTTATDGGGTSPAPTGENHPAPVITPGGESADTPVGDPPHQPAEERTPTPAPGGESSRTTGGESADVPAADPPHGPADLRTGRDPLTRTGEEDGSRAPGGERADGPVGDAASDSLRERAPRDTPTRTPGGDGGRASVGEPAHTPVSDPPSGSPRERAGTPAPSADREGDGFGDPHVIRDEDDFFVTDRDPRAPAPTDFLMTPALPAEQPLGRGDDGFDDLYDATPPRSPLVSPTAPDPRAGSPSPSADHASGGTTRSGEGAPPLPAPVGTPATGSGDVLSPPVGEGAPVQERPAGGGLPREGAEERAGNGVLEPAPGTSAGTDTRHGLETPPGAPAETGDARQSALNTAFLEALTAPLPPPGNPVRTGPGTAPHSRGDGDGTAGVPGVPPPGGSALPGGDLAVGAEGDFSPQPRGGGSEGVSSSPSTAVADTPQVPRTSSASPHTTGADGGRRRTEAGDGPGGGSRGRTEAGDGPGGGALDRPRTGSGSSAAGVEGGASRIGASLPEEAKPSAAEGTPGPEAASPGEGDGRGGEDTGSDARNTVEDRRGSAEDVPAPEGDRSGPGDDVPSRPALDFSDIPRSSAEDGFPLPQSTDRGQIYQEIAEERIERDGNGLITRVDGRPAADFLTELITVRAQEAIRERVNSPDPARRIPQSVVGGWTGVNALVLDLRSGVVAEGVNGNKASVIPPDRVHPVLRARIDAMYRDPAVDGYPQFDRRTGQVLPKRTPYPGADKPLRHAEVKAINELLWARGENAGEDALGDFMIYNTFPLLSEGISTSRCCPNCTKILWGAQSAAGWSHFTPGDPDGPQHTDHHILLPDDGRERGR